MSHLIDLCWFHVSLVCGIKQSASTSRQGRSCDYRQSDCTWSQQMLSRDVMKRRLHLCMLDGTTFAQFHVNIQRKFLVKIWDQMTRYVFRLEHLHIHSCFYHVTKDFLCAYIIICISLLYVSVYRMSLCWRDDMSHVFFCLKLPCERSLMCFLDKCGVMWMVLYQLLCSFFIS